MNLILVLNAAALACALSVAMPLAANAQTRNAESMMPKIRGGAAGGNPDCSAAFSRCIQACGNNSTPGCSGACYTQESNCRNGHTPPSSSGAERIQRQIDNSFRYHRGTMDGISRIGK